MLKKYSVLGISVGLLCLASMTGCVAETVSTTDEATASMNGSLRTGDDALTNDIEATGASIGKPIVSPIVVQLAPRVDPGLDPSVHVMGDPQPQPWTEPKKRAHGSDDQR